MRRIAFTADDIETMRSGRIDHPDAEVRRRLDVLWFKSQGMTHVACALFTGNSLRTVIRYVDRFLADGLAGVEVIRRHRPTSRLDDFRGLLEDHFNDHPPATAAQAQADILRLTGLQRGLTQVRAFLKKLSA